MGWSLAADCVLVIHLGFVVFIVVGAWSARWIRWVVWPHLAALTYGAAIQTIGFTCPLTPLEKSLRRAAGEGVYEGGFIGHYITPVLYPGELTFTVKAVMVLGIASINGAIYWWLFHPVTVRALGHVRPGQPRFGRTG